MATRVLVQGRGRAGAQPSSHPRPPPSLSPPSALAPTQHRLIATSRSQKEAHDEEHEEAREQARLDRTLLPHTRWLLPCAPDARRTPTVRCTHTARSPHADCTHTCTPACTPTHSHRTPTYSLAQVRLIQRALLGEDTRDEALEETKLVTPIKKKEGGRHVHQPVDEGGPNALSSTTARQPTSLVGRTRLLLVAALHTLRRRASPPDLHVEVVVLPSARLPKLQAHSCVLPTGRRSGSGRRDRHLQEEEAAGAVRVRWTSQEEGVPAPPAWPKCPGSALLALCLPEKRTCSRSLLAAGVAPKRPLHRPARLCCSGLPLRA